VSVVSARKLQQTFYSAPYTSIVATELDRFIVGFEIDPSISFASKPRPENPRASGD